MTMKPICTENDYREALRRIETLMDTEAKTSDGDSLDILVTLAEAYERKTYPLEMSDSVKTEGACPSNAS